MPVTIGGSGPITGVTSINTTVSDTELGYLDGVSSALQTQINAKANDSSQGLYLITPTSIANSGGSASASGGTVTFTTVNSVSLNGVFSSTYQNYEIVLPFESSSTGADMTLRLRASGTDATGTNYYIQQLYILGSNAPSGATGNNAQYVFAGSGTTKYAGRITLYRPNEAANTFANSFFWNQATALMFRGMEHQVASAYDGFTIYPSTGTITGTVRVYGYKN